MKRNTSQRMAIEEVFGRHDRPLGVGEVLAYGRRFVESLDQSTVYRNLKILVASGRLKRLVHPTLGTLYERTGKGHHHHFHCRSCDRAFELPGCALKVDGAAPAGFVVDGHEVFLFGVCAACSRTRRGARGVSRARNRPRVCGQADRNSRRPAPGRRRVRSPGRFPAERPGG